MPFIKPALHPILSPEDLKALEDVRRHFARSLPNKHVNQAGLKPWMRQFAAWFALEGNAYPRQQQLNHASALAHGRLNHGGLRKLLHRPDFLALVDRYSDDKVEATRDRFKDMLPKIADNIEWSMDQARKEEDYRAMPLVVEPVLSRTMPKKDDTPPTTQVTINLTTERFATLERPLQTVEYEELPPERDPDEKTT